VDHPAEPIAYSPDLAKEQIAMPNSGAFHLLSLIGHANYMDEVLEELKLVIAQCQGCSAEFTATSPSNGLEQISRGVVLTCPKCRNRQAISGARFVALMKGLVDAERPHEA
jgi:DNA-directed RNA polymerase subunit RPC12/RpoP